MKKSMLMVAVVFSFTVFFLSGCGDVDKEMASGAADKEMASGAADREMALLSLVQEKCTKCHDAALVQNIHKLEKSPTEIVKKMQQKKDSGISVEEALNIAGVLEKPTWEMLVTECTKCHNLDRVIRACDKGPVPIVAIKRMQKKGANITDEQVKVIHELLNKKARFEKHITLLDLFSDKCTKCHDASRAQKIHEKEKKAMETVLEMQKKEGVAMSDEEVINIAKFLEAPYWLQPLFKSECTQCHPMDVIVKTCVKDPYTSGIPKETIKMMQKKGAKITDKQVDEIYEILNRK